MPAPEVIENGGFRGHLHPREHCRGSMPIRPPIDVLPLPLTYRLALRVLLHSPWTRRRQPWRERVHLRSGTQCLSPAQRRAHARHRQIRSATPLQRTRPRAQVDKQLPSSPSAPAPLPIPLPRSARSAHVYGPVPANGERVPSSPLLK